MTMKAAIVKRLFGEIEDVVAMSETFSRPHPSSAKGTMLVRVLACSLAPGDVRVLTGQCDKFQSPGSFPYVPGGDVCGIVEEVPLQDCPFQRGDCVVSTFEGPARGLAQYALVKVSHSELKPPSLDAVVAAALPSSALTAMLASRLVKQGERILVLGGSGGVGTTLVQLARLAGASHVAATTSHVELVRSLGVDRVIDYRKEDWWDLDEYKAEPFDVVFDLVSGDFGWKRALTARRARVLKSKARWFSTSPDNPHFEIHNWGDALRQLSTVLWRQFWTKWWPGVPVYKFLMGLVPGDGNLKELLKITAEKKYRVVLNPASPLPFTEEGVKRGLLLQQSRHAVGKLVVKIE